MRSRLWLVAPALATLGIACATNPTDISGLYYITSHTVDTTGCFPGPEVTDGPSYFLMTRGPASGHAFFERSDCDSMDTTMCTPIPGLFVDAETDGWHGFVSTAVPGENQTCTLTYTDFAALYDPSPSQLRLEMHSYVQDGVVGSDCSTHEAELRGAQMPCVNSEIVVGTFLQQ